MIARLVPLFLLIGLAGSCGGTSRSSRDTLPDIPPDASAPDALDAPSFPEEADSGTVPEPEPEPVPEPVPELAPEPVPDAVEPPDALAEAETVIPQGPMAWLCRTGCETDADCGVPNNRCLTFQTTNQRFCAIPCPVDGGCPEGFSCATVNAEKVCVPWTSDCDTAFVSVTCNGTSLAGLCKGSAPECTSMDWRPGYCTKACVSDADCPGTMKRCVAGLCRASWTDGPEGCGVAPGDVQGVGEPCRDAGDCKPSGMCVDPGEGQPASKFCTHVCTTDADCAAPAFCAEASGASVKVCLTPACACLAKAETMYDQALAAVGLDRCRAFFPKSYVQLWLPSLGRDPWRLSRFHELHDYPPRAVPGTRSDLAKLDGPSGPSRVVRAIEAGAALLDRPVQVYEGIPPSANLAAAITTFIATAGGTPDPTTIANALGPVPQSLAASLAPVVDAMTDALIARKAISTGIGDPAMDKLLFDSGHGIVLGLKSGWGLSPKNKYINAVLTQTFDFVRMFSAGHRLAAAVAKADLKPDPSWPAFAVRIETPAGAILLRGTGDDLYDPDQPESAGPLALIVDVGGNDTYRVAAGANTAIDNPVSLVLDLAGDDHYGYTAKADAPDPLLLPEDEDGRYKPSATPDKDNGPISLSDRGRQGCGRMGLGMLFDLGAGKDEYRSLRISQGAGILGVGILYDGGGDDAYLAEAGSQGAGILGIGVLVDEGGNDIYSGFHAVQGFAYARGYGLLLDAAGDDTYLARLGDSGLGGLPMYYNPQNPGKSNSSMAQGFGFGRRADTTDLVFMSGGFGVLRDLAGNDSYTCDIFGQGGGYWFGSGILADAAGNDAYKGRWYVQGAGAHFALGILLDDGGDDVHNRDLPLLNASLGLGHDFSLGVFVDVSGDDEYHSPSLALGAGNDNGIGLFVDGGGKDAYAATATNTFGWGSNTVTDPLKDARGNYLGLGVFLDAGGPDTYARPDFAGVPIQDGSLWTQAPAKPNQGPNEKGAGMDAEAMPTGL